METTATKTKKIKVDVIFSAYMEGIEVEIPTGKGIDKSVELEKLSWDMEQNFKNYLKLPEGMELNGILTVYYKDRRI